MIKQRRAEISYLNVMFCLLVVFIHIVSGHVSAFEVGSLRYNIVMFAWRMCSFVVQGFILLSGIKLFLTKKDEIKYGKYLFLRIKSIIVPYAVCFLAYYVFYYLKYNYPLDFGFMLKHFLFGSLAYHMYFVPLIFQFDLLFPLWKKVVNKCPAEIVVPFCLMFAQIFEIYLPTMVATSFSNVNFVYNDRIFTTYLSYWIVGCYIGKNYDNFISMLKNNFGTVCAVFCMILVPWGYYTYLAYNNLKIIPFMNQLHNLYVMAVILFVFALSVKLSEKLPKLVKLIDVISYDVYLWHVFLIFLADYIIERYGIMAQSWCFVIRFVLAYGVTVLVCIMARKLKQVILKSK